MVTQINKTMINTTEFSEEFFTYSSNLRTFDYKGFEFKTDNGFIVCDLHIADYGALYCFEESNSVGFDKKARSMSISNISLYDKEDEVIEVTKELLENTISSIESFINPINF